MRKINTLTLLIICCMSLTSCFRSYFKTKEVLNDHEEFLRKAAKNKDKVFIIQDSPLVHYVTGAEIQHGTLTGTLHTPDQAANEYNLWSVKSRRYRSKESDRVFNPVRIHTTHPPQISENRLTLSTASIQKIDYNINHHFRNIGAVLFGSVVVFSAVMAAVFGVVALMINGMEFTFL